VRKLRILKTINILVLFCLVMALIMAYFYPIILPFNKIWYVIIIAFYSIMLYFKYALFGSDNVLWFAITLTLFAVYIVLYNLKILGMATTPIISLIPAFSSLILFMIYKNELHLNLLVLLFITGAPGFLLSYRIVSFWWFVIVEIVANIVAMLLINLIHINYKKG